MQNLNFCDSSEQIANITWVIGTETACIKLKGFFLVLKSFICLKCLDMCLHSLWITYKYVQFSQTTEYSIPQQPWRGYFEEFRCPIIILFSYNAVSNKILIWTTGLAIKSCRFLLTVSYEKSPARLYFFIIWVCVSCWSLMVSSMEQSVHLEGAELCSTWHDIPFWLRGWRKEEDSSSLAMILYSTSALNTTSKGSFLMNGRKCGKLVASVHILLLYMVFHRCSCSSGYLFFFLPFLVFTLPIERDFPTPA